MAARLAQQADRQFHAWRREIAGLGRQADADRVCPASRTVVTPAARVRAQLGTELRSASDGGVMRMRTRLVPEVARWTCMSMNPGSESQIVILEDLSVARES